ncbi:MAG: helix-turn-helix domain-containing protein [Nocardioidaceae bacterium]
MRPDKLHRDPDLVTTVTRYFQNDFNRRDTARQLYVHPNTVHRRLSRIADLTGANPRTARGLLVLGAALVRAGPTIREACPALLTLSRREG